MKEDIKRRVYGIGTRQGMMSKTAAPGTLAALLALLPGALEQAGQITALGSAYILGSAMLTGAGAGYAVSKITSHSARDMDTVKKGYDNERLKADIGYLDAKLKQERADANVAAPKAARIFN